MTTLTLFALAAILSVVLALGLLWRGAHKVEPRDPAYWRRRGLL